MRNVLKVIPFLLITLLFSCKEDAKKQESEHQFTNALINETSPYLLQHAHNPVNWRPWSNEALIEAEKENKLVLISVGYSSCHWCHVMEEETFEDVEVAQIMNENFISIKVDREERPDVDQIYMTALQLINDGNGGWPLNVITLPNGKPLYGGTYHTKEQWMQVLTKISELYTNDPQKAAEYSDMVTEGIAEVNLIEPSSDFKNITKESLHSSLENWKPIWDLEEGGNQGAEKFIIPTSLDFLMDYAALSKDADTKSYVKITLDKIAQGGIYDQIGGGFYRYSTDPYWKVPHFEKMLYDNAQLISIYSKAYKVYQEPSYKKVVEETIAFLNREMKDANGGFHAAINADSEGVEGKFYIWKLPELKAIISDDFELFSKYYNVRLEAVWEEGNYVLHTASSDSDFATKNNISLEKLEALKEDWKSKLLKARYKRIRPTSDDKIITSWNALLINGLVDAYKTFGNRAYLEEAVEIFDFINMNSYSSGELLHSYKEGSKIKEGFLEDYTFLAAASLDLYEVTYDTKYLNFATTLTQTAEKNYADEPSGLYRYTTDEQLIAKIIKTDDGVLPSANSVMAQNLFRLGHLHYDVNKMEKSKKMLATIVPSVIESASSFANWNQLLLYQTYPYYEIAVVGQEVNALVKKLNLNFIPNAIIVGSKTESTLPLFEERYDKDNTFIYVCQNNTCKLPVTTVEEAMPLLR